MTSPPVVRPISWIAAIPQFIALALAAGIGVLLSPANWTLGMTCGAGVYVLYSFGSRAMITRDHRAGIVLNSQRRFADAIPYFQRSFEFFDRHDWIDRYRSIVLMTPGAISYREMALVNIAFCYVQIGDGVQACMSYERCLKRFPRNEIALGTLRMMDAAQQSSKE